MNTETIVHPKLHHLGLTTSDLEVMMEWYHKEGAEHEPRSPIGGAGGRTGGCALTHHGMGQQ